MRSSLPSSRRFRWRVAGARRAAGKKFADQAIFDDDRTWTRPDHVRTNREGAAGGHGAGGGGCGCTSAVATPWGLRPGAAWADDRAEVSTSLFVEPRGRQGRLTVIHPQADFGIDLGRFVTLDAAYSADAVSGATSVIYQADAISSATTFSDTRHEGTVGFGIHGKRSRLDVSATLGTERDYLSHQVGGSASIDLPGRNTTVALAYSHSFDQVCDKDNGMLSPQETKALTGADPWAVFALMRSDRTARMTWLFLSMIRAGT
jgi:hypothetical protein